MQRSNYDGYTLWFAKRNGPTLWPNTLHGYTKVTQWLMAEQVLGRKLAEDYTRLSRELCNYDHYNAISYFQPNKWARRGADQNSVETIDSHYETCNCYACQGIAKYPEEY